VREEQAKAEAERGRELGKVAELRRAKAKALVLPFVRPPGLEPAESASAEIRRRTETERIAAEVTTEIQLLCRQSGVRGGNRLET